VTAEFYNCAIEVMRGAEAIDRYEAMDPQEALTSSTGRSKEAKLRRQRPRESSTGSGRGGRRRRRHREATALRLVEEGAHVACVDREPGAAAETAQEIVARHGDGIGVAGTGIATAARRSPQLRHHRPGERRPDAPPGSPGLRRAGLGRRHRGVFVPPDADGRIEDRQWGLTFASTSPAPTSSPTRPTASSAAGPAGDVVLTPAPTRWWPRREPRLRHQQGGRQPTSFGRWRSRMAPLVRVNAWPPPPSSRAARCSRATG